MKLLIVNTHGIGDVVMTIPMINTASIAGYQISILVKSPVEALVLRNLLPKMNLHFICFSDYKKSAGLLRLIRKIQKCKFDAIVPTYSMGAWKYNILALASGAPKKLGLPGRLQTFFRHVCPEPLARHKADKQVEVLIAALDAWQQKIPDAINHALPVFHAEQKLEAEVQAMLGLQGVRYVCLAPGSGIIEQHKRWPASKYAELSDLLCQNGLVPVLVGGPGEEELAAEIAKQAKNNPVSAVGKLGIAHTLHLLHGAACVVANCNGVSHLAAAVQAPVVGIYGPTDPWKTGPYSTSFNVVTLSLECSPCYSANNLQGCGNPVCMDGIGADLVFAHVCVIMKEIGSAN